MNIIRLFFATALLLLVISCGKKESKPQAKKNVKPAAAQQKQANGASLYDEFFENSSDSSSAQSSSSSGKSSSSYSDVSDVRFSPNGRYVVQISTVATPELANVIVKKLEKSGYPAYVASVENPTTALLGTYYRVRIGGFDNLSDAKYFGENVLKPLGYDYWVDNKSNDNLGISGSGLGAYNPSNNRENEREGHKRGRHDASDTHDSHDGQPAPSFEVEPTVSSATGETMQASGTSSGNNASRNSKKKSANDDNWDHFEW